MRRNPPRHKARSNDSYPFSSPSSANNLLDTGLEYALLRASQLPQVDLTATAAPEITALDALLSMQVPDPQWIIPGLLPVGITLLTGKQWVGKSWLALALTCNVPVLGHMPASQGCVLYLGLEETRYHALDRAAKLLQGQPAPNTLKMADSWHPLAAGGLADIEDWLEQHETARLVVIDSLISVYAKPRSHRSSGSKARENTIMIPLKVIADMHQIAILVIQHLEQAHTSNFAHDAGFVSKAVDYMDIVDCTLLLKQERDTPETTLHITGQHIAEKVVTV
ncbi:MAG TPA: AAA family ATPase [Ktedonobacteraceae bacterium]|nr:AAA family ATPase [Ktedonobacteraceae bacterium]